MGKIEFVADHELLFGGIFRVVNVVDCVHCRFLEVDAKPVA